MLINTKEMYGCMITLFLCNFWKTQLVLFPRNKGRPTAILSAKTLKSATNDVISCGNEVGISGNDVGSCGNEVGSSDNDVSVAAMMSAVAAMMATGAAIMSTLPQ